MATIRIDPAALAQAEQFHAGVMSDLWDLVGLTKDMLDEYHSTALTAVVVYQQAMQNNSLEEITGIAALCLVELARQARDRERST
jgi:hypothetical protein